MTSVVPQPFWAKTVAVSFAICWSVGNVNFVSDPVVLWVPCPVAGTVPGPLARSAPARGRRCRGCW